MLMQPVLTCTIAPHVNLEVSLSFDSLSPSPEEALGIVGQRLLAALALFKREFRCWLIYNFCTGEDFRPLGIERFTSDGDLAMYLQQALAHVSPAFARQTQTGQAGVRIERREIRTEVHDMVQFLIWWDEQVHPAHSLPENEWHSDATPKVR